MGQALEDLVGVNAGMVTHLEWSGVDKADPTHFTTATSQVVKRAKGPEEEAEPHECSWGHRGTRDASARGPVRYSIP